MFDPNEDIEDLYRQAADRFDLESSGPDWERMSRALDKIPVPGVPGRSGGLQRFISSGSRIIPAGITVAVVFAGAVLLVSKRAAHTQVSAQARVSVAARRRVSAEAGSPTATEPGRVPERGVLRGSATAAMAGRTGTGIAGAPEVGVAGGPGAARTAGPAEGPGAGVTGGPVQTGWETTLQDIPLTTNTDLPLPLEQVRISTDRLQSNRPMQPLVQGASAGTGPVVSPLRAAGRFSAGVSGALDLSFVEGQSLSQPGSSGGILAGMQLNRLINLETGLYISHKIYYTSGAHMPKVPLPYGSKLLNARAHTSLVEVPLTLRYSIAGMRSGVLYAGAGVAAYLVNSEVYNYQAEWLGRKKEGEWTYPGKIPQRLLSALTANIGYRWNVDKTNVLRTELYGKLPLAGLGKAAIPVTSTGLSLSFLHAF